MCSITDTVMLISSIKFPRLGQSLRCFLRSPSQTDIYIERGSVRPFGKMSISPFFFSFILCFWYFYCCCDSGVNFVIHCYKLTTAACLLRRSKLQEPFVNRTGGSQNPDFSVENSFKTKKRSPGGPTLSLDQFPALSNTKLYYTSSFPGVGECQLVSMVSNPCALCFVLCVQTK